MLKAVILCAGKGTRLRPLTKKLPKVMLPINGKPVLEHHIEYYKRYDVREIYINLHYLPRKIKDYFGEGKNFGVNITYSYEEELLDTAGALNGFRKLLSSDNVGSFIVHYGDVISEVNLEKMLSYHNEKSSAATLAVHPTNRPHDSDIVVLTGENRVTKLYHKPGTKKYGNLGNAAFYILEPKFFNYLPKEGKFDFVQDILPKMVNCGEPIYGYRTQEFLKDMGTPSRYIEVKRRLEGDNFQNPFSD